MQKDLVSKSNYCGNCDCWFLACRFSVCPLIHFSNAQKCTDCKPGHVSLLGIHVVQIIIPMDAIKELNCKENKQKVAILDNALIESYTEILASFAKLCFDALQTGCLLVDSKNSK